MAEINKYNLEFRGLAQGNHQFDYQIGKSFFDYFDGGIAEDGTIQLRVDLEKRSSYLKLKFTHTGTLTIQCDRCLEYYNQTVSGENDVFVKFGKEEDFEIGDNVIWVDTNEHRINIGKMVYDFIILSIPIRHVHPDNAAGDSLCDPDMMDKLNKLSVSSTESNVEKIDSRWDELRKLLENE